MKPHQSAHLVPAGPHVDPTKAETVSGGRPRRAFAHPSPSTGDRAAANSPHAKSASLGLIPKAVTGSSHHTRDFGPIVGNLRGEAPSLSGPWGGR